MSEELKRCPFCGGVAAIQQYQCYLVTKVLVRCTRCGARTLAIEQSPDYCARDRVAKAWNRREQFNEWIPAEQPPDTSRAVLARVRYPDEHGEEFDEYDTHIAYHDDEGWHYYHAYDDIDDYVEGSSPEFNAWMELPKYYEEVKK